jgi:hypothetical protein
MLFAAIADHGQIVAALLPTVACDDARSVSYPNRSITGEKPTAGDLFP